MKRWQVALLALLAAGTFAAAAPVKIDFWYSMGGANGDLIQSMVKDFNEANKDVVVTATYQGNYYDTSAKIQAAVASNTTPNVSMVVDMHNAMFASAGVLADLGPFMKRDKVDVNDFIPGLLDWSFYEGKTVSLPFNRSTPLFYFNKDHLREAGLDENGPKTWEELRSYARKLTRKGERFGFSCPIDIWFYLGMVFQNGGEVLAPDGKHIGFNNDIGTKPIVFWREMIDEGIMKMPPGKEYNAWDVAMQDFLNGKTSMIMTSTGYLYGILSSAKGKFDVGTGYLPRAKQYGTPTGGANVAVIANKPAQEIEASWRFVKYLTDVPQVIRFSQKSGYMTSRKSAVAGPEMQAFFKGNPQFKTAIDQLYEAAKKRPAHPNYPQLDKIIMDEIQRAVIDRSYAPEQALKAIDAAAQRLF
ncbi:MAG TPA: ABC transporter substrate-binding protein [Spirochaetales bacterium]|nr:ABC transporter substrate-binding protein [Spirochaetales bacterium]HRY56019.1 ABC transporter substrate-binding protein [Spirochaetia bacterium]